MCGLTLFTDNPKIYRVCPRIYRLRSKIYRPRPRIYRVRPKIYRVFPHFTDDNSTITKEKRQKEKTTRSNPWPHRRQLQLDERFGCIQPTVRKQRVASRCYTSFSETRQCLLTRQWWRRIWVTQLAVDIKSRRWSFRTCDLHRFQESFKLVAESIKYSNSSSFGHSHRNKTNGHRDNNSHGFLFHPSL